MTLASAQQQLNALSRHLHQQRDQLLEAWRAAVQTDPELTTSSSLSRIALDDHLPGILTAFEDRLRADHAVSAVKADVEQRTQASEHGSHRWQQGYDFRETLREWGHLQLALLAELDRYAAEHPPVPQEVMARSRAAVAALCMEGSCESASRYLRLQQAEAASRMQDLEESFNALQTLENERAALLHETAHDLHGSVGVIANVGKVLAQLQVEGSQRDRFHQLLQQHIHSMSVLLKELMELARLEAGRETLQIQPFDAAARLREICDGLRPLAVQRDLFLRHEGPATLPVQGDPVKLLRIVQNLVLNALKATQQGGVIVSWFLRTDKDAQQWSVRVQDSGPGLQTQAAAPLLAALKDATEDAQSSVVGAHSSSRPRNAQIPVLPRSETQEQPLSPPSGEGIGLTIVKRLCELLGASVELNTASGSGTTIQISFPLHYTPHPQV